MPTTESHRSAPEGQKLDARARAAPAPDRAAAGSRCASAGARHSASYTKLARSAGFCVAAFLGGVHVLRAAQAASPEIYRPPRTEAAPAIDGLLNEPGWGAALALDDFRQRLPSEGAPPSEKTTVFLMYTGTDLYVGVRSLDSRPQSIAATIMKRDNFEVVQNDQFAVAIDSYNDGRNGYWFSTNPLGVRVDAQFFEEGEIWIGEWDGVWECASRVGGDGWTSEIRIPFSTLRFAPGEENVMGINLFRRIIRTNEQLFSPLIPLSFPNGTPNVSVARKFAFQGLSAGRDLKVRPYALAAQERSRLEGALRDEQHREIGADARYGLTPSLNLDLTLNTDFALTELDDRQINLTRFDLFFPEKREFFVESGGLFLLGLPAETELFFSRRIGLAPDDAGRSAQVPIRYGAKLTGRAGRAEIGVLDVQTGGVGDLPPENFFVARTKAGVGARSYVGMIATHRATGGSFANAALGADGTLFFSEDVGLSGFAAATRTRGESASAGDALAWSATLFKRGERDSFRVALTDIAPGFDPQMGFLLRSGVRIADAQLRLPHYLQGGRVRRVTPGYTGERVEEKGGRLQSYRHEASASVDFLSDDVLEIKAGRTFDSVSAPFSVFRAVVVPAGDYTSDFAALTFRSKPGRPLAGEVSVEGGGLYGGRQRTAASKLQWKASRHLTASLEYRTAWIDLSGDSFQTRIFQSRADVSLNTRLSASSLLQYDNASRELGLNLRLNYLFREGTKLALVYSEIAERDPTTLDHSGLFSSRSDRSLILKVAYLFDF